MSLDINREYLRGFLQGKAKIHPSDEADVRRIVKRWFKVYKEWEFEDQFVPAFKEGRMSIRQGPASMAYKKNFKVTKAGGSRSSPYPSHQYRVGMDSLKERLNPVNFQNNHESVNTAERLKYKMGLHDLSASLLSPLKPTISEQQRWKHKGKKRDSWFAVFMPLPQPEDLQLFHQLNTLAKKSSAQCPELYQDLVDIRSKMTRIKLAAPVDIGAGPKNTAPLGESPHFSYGLKEPLTPYGNHSGIDQARYQLAMHYTKIQDLQRGGSNEIVIAYRRHASTRFPLFAQWDDTAQIFVCLDGEDSSKSIPSGFIPDQWEKTIQVVGH